MLHVLTSDDLRHICEVTSCYAAWRAQEDRKNARSKIASSDYANTVKRPDSDKSVSCTPGKADSGSSPVPIDCIAVSEVVVTLQGGYGEVENILLPLDTPPGRYVIEVSDGILPACLRTVAPDTAPLGSLNSSSSSSSSSSPTCKERAAGPTSPVRSRAALEDMKDLAALVNPIRVNRHITFNAVSATIGGA